MERSPPQPALTTVSRTWVLNPRMPALVGKDCSAYLVMCGGVSHEGSTGFQPIRVENLDPSGHPSSST